MSDRCSCSQYCLTRRAPALSWSAVLIQEHLLKRTMFLSSLKRQLCLYCFTWNIITALDESAISTHGAYRQGVLALTLRASLSGDALCTKLSDNFLSGTSCVALLYDLPYPTVIGVFRLNAFDAFESNSGLMESCSLYIVAHWWASLYGRGCVLLSEHDRLEAISESGLVL